MAWKNKLKARSLEDEYRLADDVWQEQESKLSDNDSYEVQKNNNTYASTSDTSLYLRIGNIKKAQAFLYHRANGLQGILNYNETYKTKTYRNNKRRISEYS